MKTRRASFLVLIFLVNTGHMFAQKPGAPSFALFAKGGRKERWKGGMVRPERFELPTFWFVARRSIQLS
jgi:hypothetical protein